MRRSRGGGTMDIGNRPQPKGKRAGREGGDEGGGSGPRLAFRITLSAREDAAPFGSVRGAATALNARGKALAAAWAELGEAKEDVEPDALAIGPRKLEGILILRHKGGESRIGGIVRFLKVISALRLAQLDKTAAARRGRASDGAAAAKAPAPLWKQGYAGKPLRGGAALTAARKALAAGSAR